LQKSKPQPGTLQHFILLIPMKLYYLLIKYIELGGSYTYQQLTYLLCLRYKIHFIWVKGLKNTNHYYKYQYFYIKKYRNVIVQNVFMPLKFSVDIKITFIKYFNIIIEIYKFTHDLL